MAWRVICGDALEELKKLESESVHCCVTSPPYWSLRDYGVQGQIGLEATPEEYVAKLVEVFREVRRVLRKDGTFWLNLGDSYAGSGRGPTGKTGIGDQCKRQGFDSPKVIIPKGLKPKDLVGIPWRVAFALQADGWYLRSDIIWEKPNALPESVKDRPTRTHEYIFLLTKSERYYYDAEAIAEPLAQSSVRRYKRAVECKERFDPARHKHTEGVQAPMEILTRAAAGVITRGWRNKRSVWTVPTASFDGAHYATFPEELIESCILAGCPPGGTVLDPFVGSGTTLAVAERLGRHSIGIELNPKYVELIYKRMRGVQWPMLVV